MSALDSLRAASLTLRIIVPTLVDSATGRLTIDKSDERIRWWAKQVLEQAEVKLTITGQEHIPPDEPLVIMSNHRSYYDIPVVYSAIPGSIRMVGKKELFRVPLFGAAMRATGFIEVNRQERSAAQASLKASEKLLAAGTRVWIAPEGTRTKTGKLGPFKSGGFHLALGAGVRILPMAILGTEQAMAADSFAVRKGGTVEAHILPPVDAKAYGHARRKELTNDVRSVIARALKDE